MTKESIERAKEFSGHQAQKHFPMSFHESERKTAAFIGRISYLQGMQDPDANADIIAERESVIRFHLKTVKNLEYKLGSYISAVDKLNNLWLEHGCKKNVSSCDICKMHSVLHNYLDKALSSGGE